MTDWSQVKYFTEQEFKCKCGCEQAPMSFEFMKKLDQVREIAGVPFNINSGYRCPEHNNNVSSTGFDGPHTTGKAADISLSYTEARQSLEILCAYFNGIGIKQHGDPSGRFIHIDDLGLRIWTYA